MLDYVKENYSSVVDLAQDLAFRIRSCDAPLAGEDYGATEMWMMFLEEWPDHDGFPLASRVYEGGHAKPKTIMQNLSNCLSKERMQKLQPFLIAAGSSLATIAAMERVRKNDHHCRQKQKKLSARWGFWLLAAMIGSCLGLSKFGTVYDGYSPVERFTEILSTPASADNNAAGIPNVVVVRTASWDPAHRRNPQQPEHAQKKGQDQDWQLPFAKTLEIPFAAPLEGMGRLTNLLQPGKVGVRHFSNLLEAGEDLV